MATPYWLDSQRAYCVLVSDLPIDWPILTSGILARTCRIPTHIAPRPPLRRRSIALEMVGQRRTKMASFSAETSILARSPLRANTGEPVCPIRRYTEVQTDCLPLHSRRAKLVGLGSQLAVDTHLSPSLSNKLCNISPHKLSICKMLKSHANPSLSANLRPSTFSADDFSPEPDMAAHACSPSRS